MSLCALQCLGQVEGSVQANQPAVAGVRAGQGEVGGDMAVVGQLGGTLDITRGSWGPGPEQLSMLRKKGSIEIDTSGMAITM